MDKDYFLDLLELLDEERRHNEFLAFSSLDASDKAKLATAARRDSAAISDLRRRLAPTHGTRKRLPTSRHEFDAYLDSLLDSTCFEAPRTEPTRGSPGVGLPRTSRRRQARGNAGFPTPFPTYRIAQSG
jgi:hypothetical protein